MRACARTEAVGQIFETHLGWAAAGLGRQISDLLEAWQNGGQRQALMDWLRDIYGPEEELPIGRAPSPRSR